ncbi:anti-FecI sigma factor, FecR [Xanthobacter versatilis]|uniref:Anti-FecI sigma factor, FecR n=1 Tax=Xanthobacter autotrophicus (strain ATCC BAA-1158 / Py2) TaxID=78245 RepID=A7IJ25_XANP2|nr:anti-FecI sigma factor, FecR [Xanthobacter autotrophicus Py2]
MRKSQVRDTTVRPTARDAALGWFVKMRSGEATPAEVADFQQWIAAAADNRREYDALEALWGDLDQVGDPRRVAASVPASRPMMSRRGLFLGAAGVAAAVVAGVALGVPDWFDGAIRTGVGEQRQLTLADGSRVVLDADSALSLQFTPQARRLTLQRGRAFFDVAPDPARAFSVTAAGGVTTATGTQFSVHLWSNEVTVAVSESAVSIRAGAAALSRLKAGEAVSYDASGIGETEQVSDAQASAWRRGKLIFEDRPLRQVIADVNRYRPGTIMVTDSTLLRLRVSGIFDIRQPDGVLEAITRSLPVRSMALTRYLVLLYPA